MDIGTIQPAYPQFCRSGNHIRGYINSVFNQEGRVISQPKVSYMLKIENPSPYVYHINLDDFVKQHGIARNYHVEVLLTNFVTSSIEIPIFPDEIRIDCYDNTIRQRIDGEMAALRQIAQAFETIAILHEGKFVELANDLAEGLARSERHDHEGAIKFYRKVVEGLRIAAKDITIDGSESRSSKVRGFLNSSYDLMSNMGEHFGTSGSPDDALLSRDLAVTLSRFLARKLPGKPA